MELKETYDGGQRWLGHTNSPLKLKITINQTEIQLLCDRPHISDQIPRGGREIFPEMSEGVAQNAKISATRALGMKLHLSKD